MNGKERLPDNTSKSAPDPTKGLSFKGLLEAYEGRSLTDREMRSLLLKIGHQLVSGLKKFERSEQEIVKLLSKARSQMRKIERARDRWGGGVWPTESLYLTYRELEGDLRTLNLLMEQHIGMKERTQAFAARRLQRIDALIDELGEESKK